MAIDNFNGVRLRYELTSTGEVPLVLVHGGWGSYHQWDLVVLGLAESFRVLTYDRCGHSESEHPPAQARVRDNVGDLAALIERLGLAPAYVAGNSLGALIALLLAGERPDLLRGVIVHEPAPFSLLASEGDDGHGQLANEIRCLPDRRVQELPLRPVTCDRSSCTRGRSRCHADERHPTECWWRGFRRASH